MQAVIFPSRSALLGLVEGWGHAALHQTLVMHCLLTLLTAEQQKHCLVLKSAAVWWDLTHTSTLDPEVQTALAWRSNVVAVFKHSVSVNYGKGGLVPSKAQECQDAGNMDPLGQLERG